MQSSHTKIVVISIIIVVVLVVFYLSSWLFLDRLNRTLDNELENRLNAIAGLVSRQVQTTVFPDLVSGVQSLTAKSYIDPLIDNLPHEVNVQNIFLIDRRLQTLKSNSDLFLPGEEIAYLRGDSLEIRRAWTGEVVSSPLRTLTGNRFKAAYAPVRDSRGKIVCLVVIEASADFLNMLQPAKRQLVIGGIIGAGVVIVFVFFLYKTILDFLRTQENLRRSERLATMGQMAATVAHEIRNPLGIIKSTAYVLRQRYDNTAAPDELFEFIPSEVRRLNHLVNDFLSLARDKQLSFSQTDLVKTIEKAIAMLRSDEQANGVTWSFSSAAPALIVRHDEEAITQVLLNLLLNAIQALAGNGRLQIAVHEKIDKGRKFAHIVVQDDGPGLPAAVEKIFEPFFTTKTKGSGLGLAVCKQLIEKHGGHINAESEKGKGTTMNVWLPI